MSESSILPGGVPGAGLPGGGGYDDGDEGTDRRRLLLVGGAAGLLVLLVVAYLLLHGGGSSNNQSGLVPSAHLTPPPAASPSATASATSGSKGHAAAGTKLPPKSHTRLARDPFKPLFNTTAPDAGAGAATGVGGTPVSVTTVAPEPGITPGGPVVIPTVPTEGGTPTSGTGGVTTHGDPIWVELISTSGVKTATFDVGYQDHKFRRFTVDAPAAGSTQGTIFDNEFSLLSIQGNEVTIQVGDDTPFDLRKGVSHQLV